MTSPTPRRSVVIRWDPADPAEDTVDAYRIFDAETGAYEGGLGVDDLDLTRAFAEESGFEVARVEERPSAAPAPPEIPTEYSLSRDEAHERVWALVESGTDVAVVRVSVLGLLSAEVATRGRPRADRILGYGWALATVEEIEHAISEGTY